MQMIGDQSKSRKKESIKNVIPSIELKSIKTEESTTTSTATKCLSREPSGRTLLYDSSWFAQILIKDIS